MGCLTSTYLALDSHHHALLREKEIADEAKSFFGGQLCPTADSGFSYIRLRTNSLCPRLAGGNADFRGRSSFLRRTQLESHTGWLYHHCRLGTSEYACPLVRSGTLFRRRRHATTTHANATTPDSYTHQSASFRRRYLRPGL